MRPPSIDTLLNADAFRVPVARYGRLVVRDALRDALRDQAQALADQSGNTPGEQAIEAFARQITEMLEQSIGDRTLPVFNMTGVLLHSNLGRAMLDADTTAQVVREASGPLLLELDARTGRRGDRETTLAAALTTLTGAEAAAVVNNNAAAVMLVLAALRRAPRNQVIVSRGELVEIGGSFRLPDILRASGVRLVEVGTTNVTRASDYAEAINERTAAILKVHTSNYSIAGYTQAASLKALAEIARNAQVPLGMDLGSGCLIDMTRFNLPHEPLVSEVLAQGVNFVTFSGDKLMGSVQAGILLGDRALIARINRHPMKRALRLDKIRLALLAETLKAYQQPDTLSRRVPLFRALERTLPQLEQSATRLCQTLEPLLPRGFSCRAAPHMCEMGSGSMPGAAIPSFAAEVCAPSQAALKRFDENLRGLPTPVLGRVHAKSLWLDLRCIDDLDPLLTNLASLART